jgi:hypothetical protein
MESQQNYDTHKCIFRAYEWDDRERRSYAKYMKRFYGIENLPINNIPIETIKSSNNLFRFRELVIGTSALAYST